MPNTSLQAIFTAKVTTSAKLLLSPIYRDPAITAYNRLEPRARTEDFTRSLRAEVRDPLWMLTRQWQMGEFEAEDAASAIDARLLTSHVHLDRVSLRGQPGREYREQIPLETLVECEQVPFTHALKVQVGQYFLKLHSAALHATYAAKYRTAFAFPPAAEEEFRGQTDGLNLYLATRSRDFDGEKLLAAIAGDTLISLAGIAGPDEGDIRGYAESLTRWFARQYSQPAGVADNAWDTQRLTYEFQTAAPTAAGGQMVLDAGRYHEGRLDWYSFTLDPGAAALATDAAAPAVPAPMEKPISFFPAAATFKGMPNPRFWEMEDREINFGKFNASTTDQLLLLFAELGLVYGNDWSVIPYALPVNTLCEVKGLVVTDVFGERTIIRAADDAENNWQRWSMFSLSNKDELGSYNRQFLLPATLAQTLESEPIEEVNFLRDEMVNMVWAVEERIPDATGAGINGHDAADKTGVQPPPIAESTANIRYVLGTTVPENWIPFLPVHLPGSNQQTRFQRAAMPKLGGGPPTAVVKPKGKLLTEVPAPYYVNEEEIPASGTLVRRSYQRARWYGGRTFLWIGRTRETGRGPGSSNLRFDQIEPLTP